MIHKIFLPDGKRLASREVFMMLHPGREPDCDLESGDLVELEEGIFLLNEDLNPMELATAQQIQAEGGSQS